MADQIRVMMLGLRGFPGVQGGVETHAEHLCPLLVDAGCDVTVLVRSPYQPVDVGFTWSGVKFVPLWAPKSKGLEAIVHTFLGVLYAAMKRPDVLHIQAIGPGIMTPLARLLGLRVVVTHHGPDYDRQKWGRLARCVLRSGEFCAMRFATARIAISRVIVDLVKRKHGVECTLIRNGVDLPDIPDSHGELDRYGLVAGHYVLLVSRLVPEKRHIDLINAFQLANPVGWKLVLVGASDHPDAYVKQLINITRGDARVVMTGLKKGSALQELFGHAGMFVLPSSHEGLPIALLEALSYGLRVVASDIPANLEVGLPSEQYFRLGDVGELAERISSYASSDVAMLDRKGIRDWVSREFDWHQIAHQTLSLYQSVAIGE